ncbi:MAG: Ig-like domain-containing protein [Fodinibius sp.]|nr:Ig-like domain-containing protein [Fodinibius sp.]
MLAPDESNKVDPGSITLSSISNKEVGVSGTGQTEQSKLSFQVTDNSGNPLTGDNSVNVTFRTGKSSPSGAEVSPKTVTTNAEGVASTTLSSGTQSGVVQVVAEVQTSNSTLTSKPVSVAISAGPAGSGWIQHPVDRRC